MLFILNNQLKDKNLIILFLKSIKSLTSISDNCYQLFFNIKIYSSFLDICFANYRLKGKDEEKMYDLSKIILIITLSVTPGIFEELFFRKTIISL